jgi:peptide/nickel transport system permease protein
MTAYVIRRLLWLPFVLLVVSFFTFAIARFGPGDPVSVAAGQIRDEEVLAQIRADRGLDGSIAEQYQRWLFDAVRGDFGESFQQRGFTVSEIIFPKMWVSAQLGLIALLIVFGLGIPLGLLAARLNGTWVDPFVIGTLLFLQAIPVLVVIPPLLWLFAVQFDILPVGGWDGLFDIWWIGGVIAIPIPDPHLYIPLLAFTLPGFAGVARLTRLTALEVQQEDYIRTARAKGLPEHRVIFRHALGNALIPVITLLGLYLPFLLSGAVVTETIFAWPGMGRVTIGAIFSRDYPIVMATNLIAGVMVVGGNLIADILYGIVDPRIRYE